MATHPDPRGKMRLSLEILFVDFWEATKYSAVSRIPLQPQRGAGMQIHTYISQPYISNSSKLNT